MNSRREGIKEFQEQAEAIVVHVRMLQREAENLKDLFRLCFVFIESVNFTIVLYCPIRQTLRSKTVFHYSANILLFFFT